ncbi:hypothetical protein AMAG_12674 [Allomyces macrogynus ATCC 38327]|uniref:Uncharacterized protein n=1 Tax=Allomyces macrogynus (strain ATCC 38327) TaxID=578462 RepID=A0A0L0T131_ALLM3|nr:hypothetical protein AMAG_12674 [Allomyces macrogynus ATCC 38327]|eukprot:KNE68498.1 hypothetical protein AMAG_12674 [Allomyces macrogynus ATCC 38327]
MNEPANRTHHLVESIGTTQLFARSTIHQVAPWRMNLLQVASEHHPGVVFVARGDKILGLAVDPVMLCTGETPVVVLGHPDGPTDPRADPADEGTPTINQIRVGHFGEHEALVAVDDFGRIMVWLTEFLHRPPILLTVGQSAWGIAIHRDRHLLAVSCNSHDITVWDLRFHLDFSTLTGSKSLPIYLQSNRVLHGHAHNVPAIAFDPSSRFLASVSIDQSCKLWDLSTGNVVWSRSFDEWMWQVEFVPFDALDVTPPAAADDAPPDPPAALDPSGPTGLILCTSKGGMFVLGPNGALLDANPLFFPRPRPYFAGYCYRTSMLERLGDSAMYLATNQWGEVALVSVCASFGGAEAAQPDPPAVSHDPIENEAPAELPAALDSDPESDDGWASTDDDDDEDENAPTDQTPLLAPQTVDDGAKGGWDATLQRHHVVRVETPPSGIPVLGVAVQRIGPADVLTGCAAIHRVFMCLLTGECAVVDVSTVTV